MFSPFIHDEFTLARVPGLEEVLGGVDVCEDGDEVDDAAEDPDPHDQGDHHVPAACWCTLELETKAIQRFAKVSIVSYSCPSLMIIASRTQFHVERPWGQRPFSIVS